LKADHVEQRKAVTPSHWDEFPGRAGTPVLQCHHL